MPCWREGEDIAAAYLEESGWKILARNFRNRRGEIDIVAAREQTILFVEVKTWKANLMSDLEHSMNSRKKHTYIELSRYFLHGHREYENHYVRFDVLCVDASDGSVRYLENAFTENG